MSESPAAPVAPRKKRKQASPFPLRLSAQERAELQAAADRAGEALGTYIRGKVLFSPTTRARRRPLVDVVALTQVQVELRRIGVNIHQVMKDQRFTGTHAAEDAREAFEHFRVAVAALLKILGMGAP